MGLKMRFQARDLFIVDTHHGDELIGIFDGPSPPRPHDMDAALALMNVGVDGQLVCDLLSGPVPRGGG